MKVLFLFLFFCLPALSKTPMQIARQIEKDIMSDTREFTYTKKLIDQGVNRAMEIATNALVDRSHFDLANEVWGEWTRMGRTVFLSNRDIGDHEPIIKKLNEIYFKIEMVLGREFCVNSHIAALLTFNSANVVVRPCTFPMDSVQGTRKDEYQRHFAGRSVFVDSYYNGVLPEAVYFAIQIGCMSGTAGIGSVLCGLAAGAGERLTATFIAPKLSDKIYDRFCSKP